MDKYGILVSQNGIWTRKFDYIIPGKMEKGLGFLLRNNMFWLYLPIDFGFFCNLWNLRNKMKYILKISFDFDAHSAIITESTLSEKQIIVFYFILFYFSKIY